MKKTHTRQKLEDKKIINQRIEELKKEFKKFTSNRIGEMYKILSKIVEIRKQENRRYAPRSLEWEKDLNLNSMQIRYIFSYQYISGMSERLIEEGKITDTAVCCLIYRFSFLKEPQWQNRMVQKYLNKEIRISESAEMGVNELKDFLLGKKIIRKDDKYILTATKTLRSMSSRLRKKQDVLKKSKHKKSLLYQINELKREVEGYLK